MTKAPELTDEQIARTDEFMTAYENEATSGDELMDAVGENIPALIAYARQRNELLKERNALMKDVGDKQTVVNELLEALGNLMSPDSPYDIVGQRKGENELRFKASYITFLHRARDVAARAKGGAS